jgi:hypothetical protein
MAMQAFQGVVIELPISSDAARRVRRAQFGVTGLRGLRLTRRGRLIVWTLALAVSAFAGSLLGGAATATEIKQGVAVDSYAVSSGETLWEIASSINPGMDNRDLIMDIMELNGLRDAALRAGQLILLPTFSE